jgi:hypothetical protein
MHCFCDGWLAEGRTQSAMSENKENIGSKGSCMEKGRTTDTILRNVDKKTRNSRKGER